MGKPTADRVSGPLQPFASGFVFWLIELGYEWTAQRARLRLMAELSSWMAARGVEPVGLTLALVEEFSWLRAPGRRGCRGARKRRSDSCWCICAAWAWCRSLRRWW